MNMGNVAAAMGAALAVPYVANSPEWDLADWFPQSSYWKPQRPNRHTAKLKRKRRIRNRMAKASRKNNRTKT